jgi:hypothetical protein
MDLMGPFLLDVSNRDFLLGEPFRSRAVLRARLLLGMVLTLLTVILAVPAGSALQRGEVGVGEAVCLLVAVLVAQPAVYAWRRLQRARGGRVLPGELVEATSKPDEDGDVQLTVRYRFVDPEGQVIEGMHTTHRNTASPRPPEPGLPTAVLYLNARNYAIL